MIKIEKGNKVALVALSNALSVKMKDKIEELCVVLTGMEIEPICSEYLYGQDSVRGATAKNKAEELERFYSQQGIRAIFDVSGGDIANEILSEVDWDKLKDSNKIFWGYSDLTTIVNAIYQKEGMASCLYQVRNLVGANEVVQQQHFKETVLVGKESLFEFDYRFLQGNEMEGIVVGGNIRCLLKLAGTTYMPDFTDKILFLESRSGGVAQMITFLSQYKQLGAFKKVKGILLGSFTQMEEEGLTPTIEELVVEMVDNPHIPIAKTTEIGHGQDSKAIIIGKTMKLCKE
ncbi:MAG: LD-carboxypeptidase [Cellulosilyticum sp.]|nr:LD-carboxypeptidase [Cellulosilyticum sp.]